MDSGSATGADPIAAVLLDMDGVLVDSEPVYRAIVRAAVEEAGGEISDALYASLLGLPEAGVLDALVRHGGAGFDPAAYQARRRALLEEVFEAGPLAPKGGAEGLLHALSAAGLRHAVATSTPRRRALRSLALSGLAGLVGPLVCGDEVARGKPEPDIYLAAAARVDCAPRHCVVVEDSEAGVIAAVGAGMRALFVPDLGAPSAVVHESATAIVDSLEGVLQFVLEHDHVTHAH